MLQQNSANIPFRRPRKAPLGNRLVLRDLVFYYIYSQWCHPSRSETDWGQLPVMIFESEEPDPEPQDAVDCSIALNNILFNRLQSVRERVRTFAVEKAAMEINLEHDNSGEYHRLLYAYNELALELDLEEGLSSAYLQEDVDRYIPHPLFGALSLVIRRKDLGSRGLAACPAANIPVWIVRTGEEGEANLGTPILFDGLIKEEATQVQEANLCTIGKHAIRTILSRALKFIFSLSARENAAFGQQPDPYLATQHPRRLPDWRNEYLTLAQDLKRELGGYDGFSPADPVPGPSSTWVENITPDKLVAHWFAKEQKYIRDREEKLRKSLVELMEEKASGVVEWRWNKINPEDLEEVCKVAYESRCRCFVYIDTDGHSIWEEHIY